MKKQVPKKIVQIFCKKWNLDREYYLMFQLATFESRKLQIYIEVHLLSM